jgi:hypothetical protein
MQFMFFHYTKFPAAFLRSKLFSTFTASQDRPSLPSPTRMILHGSRLPTSQLSQIPMTAVGPLYVSLVIKSRPWDCLDKEDSKEAQTERRFRESDRI